MVGSWQPLNHDSRPETGPRVQQKGDIYAVVGGRVTPDGWQFEQLEVHALEIRQQILHNGDVQIDANITFLQVSDIERSRTFYAERLGLTLVLDQGECQIYRLTDTSYLGICERAEPVSSNVIVTIVSEDVAGWHERFTSAGAVTDGPPRDNPEYRIHHFFANDPDGHLIEIQRFWDTDWAESPT